VEKLRKKNIYEDQMDVLRRNFTEVMEEVREMDDVEFNLERSRVAEKIAPSELFSPHNLKNIHFLLRLFSSEESLSILEKKLEGMKKFH